MWIVPFPFNRKKAFHPMYGLEGYAAACFLKRVISPLVSPSGPVIKKPSPHLSLLLTHIFEEISI